MGALSVKTDSSLDSRKGRLVRLRESVASFEAEILRALALDLGKSPEDAYLTEVSYIYNEIATCLKSLRKWAKPKRVPTPAVLWPAKSQVIPRPRGEVLIIAPWNYPFQLAMAPLVGALAAGNRVVIKPSEHAPASAEIIKRVCDKAFLPEEVSVCLGGVSETTKLLERPWGLVFFTGSTQVGKIIMEQAARTLSPVVLELGGKSPCLITECQNTETAIKRIAWGKFLNCGQTCVAPDYLVVHESKVQEVLKQFERALHELYGDNPLQSKSYGKIVNENHYQRLCQLLSESEVLIGGERDDEALKIAPTIVRANSDSPLMREEIFGPLLPLLSFKHLPEAYEIIGRHPNPLAAYVFTDSENVEEKFREEVSSGSLCINDVVVQLTNKNLPFGGVGMSGMGRYHGQFSFEAFSHYQAVMKRSFWGENSLRYPPFGKRFAFLKLLLRWLG